MQVARHRVYVGTHTKFGISSFCRYAHVQDFNVVVTDAGLPTAIVHRYRAAGVRLLRA